jgi:hypothetical protein
MVHQSHIGGVLHVMPIQVQEKTSCQLFHVVEEGYGAFPLLSFSLDPVLVFEPETDPQHIEDALSLLQGTVPIFDPSRDRWLGV